MTVEDEGSEGGEDCVDVILCDINLMMILMVRDGKRYPLIECVNDA